MTKQGLLLITVTAVMTAAGNMMMREGILRAGGFSLNPATLVDDALRLIRQVVFDVGVILYGLASIVWFKLISVENLSTSYPLVVAMTFLLVTYGCSFWFHETISLQKILGMVIVLLGIIVISIS